MRYAWIMTIVVRTNHETESKRNMPPPLLPQHARLPLQVIALMLKHDAV